MGGSPSVWERLTDDKGAAMNASVRRGLLGFLLLATAVAGAPSAAEAQVATAAERERELLYSSAASAKLRELTRMIRDRDSKPFPYEQLVRTSDYFVRISARKHTLTGSNTIGDDAMLGPKPF